MADSRVPADVNDAVYRVVRDYGVERLAARTGTSAGVLYNKSSLAEEHHRPTLADALVWSQITGDYRIAHAFAHCLGGVFVPLHHLERQSDAALLDLVLQHEAEVGEFAAALKASLADGRVSAADYEGLNREGYETIAALLELLARLDGMSHA